MITQERHGTIVEIVIARPERANALTADMLRALVDAIAGAGSDPAARGILLTGRGDRGFSAGMDTAQFAHDDPNRAYETITLLGGVCEAVKDCPLPVAAAVHGYCVGGALEIAAAADFRVGTRTSWYSMPEVRIGIPSVLESVNLFRLMGWTRASELILTGAAFTAEDMERYGFLNAVVDDGAADRAAGYLRDCAESSREVIAQQKRLFRTWRNTAEQVAIADSRKEFSLAFARRAAPDGDAAPAPR